MSPLSRRLIGIWLIAGCCMVFAQVIIGGVTRLTGSGLSITRWEIVLGAIPPLGDTQWIDAFVSYQHTPQYQLINQGMTLSEFKFIYFWEYFHRLNARLLLVVFVGGLLYFAYRKWLSRDLLLRLGFVFLWGVLIATLGWLMVASGLIDKPYVSPLRLSLHLVTALIIFANLVWLCLYVLRPQQSVAIYAPRARVAALAMLFLLLLQLLLGGVLSGMKAGMAYPTWPTMNGEWIPSALHSLPAHWAGILYYDPTAYWEQSVIQFLHRCTAYLLVVVVSVFFLRFQDRGTDRVFTIGFWLLPFLVLLQATIGIMTVLHCVGRVPVLWGVLHQAGAMLLLADMVFIYYHLSSERQ